MALARKLPLISDRPLARAGLNSERVLWPDKGPGVFEREVEKLEDALGLTTVEKAVAWAQAGSMWPDTFGLACCAMEMISIVGSHHDIARFGMERFSSSPRQADLLIVSGRVVHKMAAPLRQVYDQMLEPKWVIAMGACASSGGMFNNYTTLQGVDKIVPVDIHVPGCPPRPEALLEGLMRIQDKVRGMNDLTRGQPVQVPIPARTGYTLLPEELSDLERANQFAMRNKELATPTKA